MNEREDVEAEVEARIAAAQARAGQSVSREIQLDLGGLGLTHVPEQVRSLPRLTVLKLKGNALRRLPAWICEVETLRILDASNNALERLPRNMSRLVQLTVLGLANNNLHKLPSELGLLVGLNVLTVHGNPLRDPPLSVQKRGFTAVLEHLRDRHQRHIFDTLTVGATVGTDDDTLFSTVSTAHSFDPTADPGASPARTAAHIGDARRDRPVRSGFDSLDSLDAPAAAGYGAIGGGHAPHHAGADEFGEDHKWWQDNWRRALWVAVCAVAVCALGGALVYYEMISPHQARGAWCSGHACDPYTCDMSNHHCWTYCDNDNGCIDGFKCLRTRVCVRAEGLPCDHSDSDCMGYACHKGHCRTYCDANIGAENNFGCSNTSTCNPFMECAPALECTIPQDPVCFPLTCNTAVGRCMQTCYANDMCADGYICNNHQYCVRVRHNLEHNARWIAMSLTATAAIAMVIHCFTRIGRISVPDRIVADLVPQTLIVTGGNEAPRHATATSAANPW